MLENPSDCANQTPAWQQVRRAYRKACVDDPPLDINWELVQSYLPLVKGTVGRMRAHFPSTISTEDLYSIGLQGLIRAAMHYDVTRAPTFIAYANLKIRGTLLDELRRIDCIPRAARGWAKEIRAAIDRVEQNIGRAATEEEIAAALNLSLAKYHERLEYVRPVSFLSLDHVHQESASGEVLSLHERLEDIHAQTARESCEHTDQVAWIKRHIASLEPMAQKVLELYYYEGLRLAEIGIALGLTESRICQIHTQAILSLKSAAARSKDQSASLQN